MTHLTESTLKETALEWLRDLGYSIVYGNEISLENVLTSPRYRLSLPKLMRGEVRVKDVAN